MNAGLPRKILFVGLNYSPEPIGIGPYTAGLAEALVDRGHKVRAVVGQPYYPEWKLYERFKGRWKSTEEHGVQITRCPHYVPANPTGGRRLVHHMSFASSAYAPARAIRREFKPDMVFTVAPSMVAVPVALRMARRAGVPLWLHVQDYEVGAAFATGLLDSGGTAAQAALQFEARMLRAADVVSTISEPMCRLAREKGVEQDRIVEIRNWANHGAPSGPVQGRGLRAEWGLEGKFVALYSGNIANKQGLEIVIDAARKLADQEDIAFVIAGEGPNRARLERLAGGMHNLQFRDLQPSDRVGELLAMADVHLLPQLAGAADLVLPSKLGNMLASGRPVVATVLPGTGIAHELEGCGVIVPPQDADAFAWSIATLRRDPALRARLGQCGRDLAAERWGKDSIVDRFEDRMERLLGEATEPEIPFSYSPMTD
ncbi:WcaI family glycosyltransferase [Qipengyuania zhejiangensis]|uniref:WcaI family glycosyltransferase n=1 Tax=Qipengyuania zhejiangensis TaxID=3077782 RepID=UPI002D780AD3|nr:WcaI family glycosyltransferase [Qipengyuania sp. Z2]